MNIYLYTKASIYTNSPHSAGANKKVPFFNHIYIYIDKQYDKNYKYLIYKTRTSI